MGRNGQSRHGHDPGTNTVGNVRAGMGGTGGGAGAGSGGLAGGAGVSRSAGMGNDDDGDVGDGGDAAWVEDGKRGGRRWLPSKSIIPLSSTFCRFSFRKK